MAPPGLCPMESFMPRGRLRWILAACLAGLTLLAYAPLWRNDFIDLDDRLYITKNDALLAGLTPQGIRWAWTTTQGGFWMPLTWMSLELDVSLSGLVRGLVGDRLLPPFVFHGQNLFWHSATVVLLFFTLQQLT